MKKEIEAFVLAGGRGSRMGEITKEQQKCLFPIDDKPVLGHIMDTLAKAFGSVDLKVGVAFRAEDVKAYIDANKPAKISVEYVPHALGVDVWDAFMSMEGRIHDTFVSMPGDVIAPPVAYTRTYELFLKREAEVTMALSPHVRVANDHGVGKLRGNQLIEYACPRPERLDPDHLVDTNIYASGRKMFSLLRRFPMSGQGLNPIFTKFIEHDIPVGGIRFESRWLHIGYPADLMKHAPNYRKRR